MEVDQDKSAEAEDPNRRHKNQRSTHSHTQESYKTLNWKVGYMQRGPGADLLRPCECCFSVRVTPKMSFLLIIPVVPGWHQNFICLLQTLTFVISSLSPLLQFKKKKSIILWLTASIHL